jgi:hypothetical protein
MPLNTLSGLFWRVTRNVLSVLAHISTFMPGRRPSHLRISAGIVIRPPLVTLDDGLATSQF